MPIGPDGAAVSHISQAHPDRVEVRGRDLTGDLMGRLSFTEYFHLLLTGEEPTEEQALLPRPPARGHRRARDDAHERGRADDARGRPGSLQGAVAAGILGCGPVILGTRGLRAAARRGAGHGWRRATGPRRSADEWRAAVHAAGERLPGFGHPVHKPLDPRAERILELADERGVSGPHVELARRFRDAAAEAWGTPLTMNVSMPIAAVMLDLGLPDRDRQGGADPRAHRRPARPPGRGAGAADRVPDGGPRRGGGGVRAPPGGRAR